MKKISLHLQILIGLALGLSFAAVSIKLKLPVGFTVNYIKPFGTIFINSLKAVSIPLIIASLVVGINSIEDTTKLSRIGGKTIFLYLISTVLSVLLGIVVANVVKPGKIISAQTRSNLIELYNKQSNTVEQPKQVKSQVKKAPLQFLIDLVPDNIFKSLSDNSNLLQIVIGSIAFGIALMKIPRKKSKSILTTLQVINEALVELIKMIMRFAPIGVFALVSSLLIEVTSNSSSSQIFEILNALVWYISTVLGALALVTFGLYPLIISLATKVTYSEFLKGIRQAQLVAFSTSSSSATLPILMEKSEKELGVSEEISSFVLPLGITINMNGTSIYQAIAVIFIAQALGLELSISAQLAIIANITFSSIGIAGVPGAAIVATALVLEAANIPAAGLALILAPDRILDMCRTVTNITGDAAVAVIVASSEKELIEKTDREI
jgi:proton glutamate symport protein